MVCKVWGVKCKVWSGECKVSSVKCKVWSVKCGVESVKCKVWSGKCEVWSVECKSSTSLISIDCIVGHFTSELLLCWMPGIQIRVLNIMSNQIEACMTRKSESLVLPIRTIYWHQLAGTSSPYIFLKSF